MADFDSSDAVQRHVLKVDGKLRNGGTVEDDQKECFIQRLFARYGWGKGPVPLPPKAVKDMGLEDMTSDKRWESHFRGHTAHLGLYRSRKGYYWMHRFDPGGQEHYLDHVGTAAVVLERFGA